MERKLRVTLLEKGLIDTEMQIRDKINKIDKVEEVIMWQRSRTKWLGMVRGTQTFTVLPCGSQKKGGGAIPSVVSKGPTRMLH